VKQSNQNFRQHGLDFFRDAVGNIVKVVLEAVHNVRIIGHDFRELLKAVVIAEHVCREE